MALSNASRSNRAKKVPCRSTNGTRISASEPLHEQRVLRVCNLKMYLKKHNESIHNFRQLVPLSSPSVSQELRPMQLPTNGNIHYIKDHCMERPAANTNPYMKAVNASWSQSTTTGWDETLPDELASTTSKVTLQGFNLCGLCQTLGGQGPECHTS